MRAVLLMVLVAACKKEAAPPAPAKPTKPVEAPKAIHEGIVNEGFIVVIPAGGNVKAAEDEARAQLAKTGGTVEEMKEPAVSDQERPIFRYANPELSDADLDAMAKGTSFAVMLKGEPAPTLRIVAPVRRDIAAAAHGWMIHPIARSA